MDWEGGQIVTDPYVRRANGIRPKRMWRPCWRNGFVEPEESKGKDDKMSEHPTIEEVYKRPEFFNAVWSKSIEYYGVTKQSIVCMEECAELIEAYDDRNRDGLTDGTRSHMVEEMADVLICLWLLEHIYDIKGRDTRTRHPSPVEACAALIKAVSKILRYGTEKERLDGLADAVEDVRRWVMLLETENGITDEELGEWVERKTVRQQRRNENDK